MSSKTINNSHQEIGTTIASEKFLNTMDGFWFVLNPNVIINSFDFVTVDNLLGSKTIGIVKELQAVTQDDCNIYFSNQLNTSTIKEQFRHENKNKINKEIELLSKQYSKGVVLAKVAIMQIQVLKVKNIQRMFL